MSNEAYAIYNELDRVLTFYYDELLLHRSKGGIYIFDSIDKVGWKICAKSIEKVVFDDSFAEYDGVESTMKWFMDCTNLKEIVGINNLRTDNVVNMSGMFWNCSSLVSLDLSSFNTEKVHSMGWMFSGCSSLSKLDVSSFNTKNVTFMGDMFSYCFSLPKLDLSNFNTEKVEYMSKMFFGCFILEDLNISSFNTDDVKSMNEMFRGCPLPMYVDWVVPVCHENLPMYHPHYSQKNAVEVYDLKKAVYAFCCGVDEEEKPRFNEDAIIPKFLPVWQAFKKRGFHFYTFMKNKEYEQIEDEELRVEVLMGACFPILKLPIAKFMTDWLNGYLDFFIRSSNVKWLETWGAENGIITDSVVLRHLFFCSTDKDIWKMMAVGVGDIESLYRWYMGMPDTAIEEATGIPCYYEKDEKKAAEFLEYLLSDTTIATDSVRNEAMRLKSI